LRRVRVAADDHETGAGDPGDRADGGGEALAMEPGPEESRHGASDVIAGTEALEVDAVPDDAQLRSVEAVETAGDRPRHLAVRDDDPGIERSAIEPAIDDVRRPPAAARREPCAVRSAASPVDVVVRGPSEAEHDVVLGDRDRRARAVEAQRARDAPNPRTASGTTRTPGGVSSARSQ
jgi:hypothetical protein